jgi:LysR family transcriptional regulator, transcriptional activator of nhaA
MLPFNYHHLYYFYSIARLGSVSRAAQELRVSQPALSAQVRQLENFLGQKLFSRVGRRLVLTEEGRSAFAYAQTIFDTGREFLDTLRDRSDRGRLRLQVGVTNSIPKSYAAALLKFILKENAAAQILLHEDTLENMVQNLKNHALDLVLSDMPFRAANQEGIENRLIGRIPIVFCAAPSLAARYRRFPRDLDGAPLLLPTAHSGVYHAILEYLAANCVKPTIIAEIQDVELIRRMALEGTGIAALNEFSVRMSDGKRKLSVIPSGRHGIHDAAYLITKQRQKSHPLVEKAIKSFRI